jgi:hypothetical protein
VSGKDFSYQYRTKRQEIDKHLPPDGGEYLYHLEEIWPFLAQGRTEPIYWCEGEKDADAIREAYGAIATSHHQGAGNATPVQAKWLWTAKHIIIVADYDDPGAFCAAWRHDLLREAGCRGRIDIVWAAVGKDAADHIAAGYGPDEFVPVDLARLTDIARRYKRRKRRNHARYMRGEYNA